MSRKSSENDISIAFEKLNITSGVDSDVELGNFVLIFQSILSAIKT